MAVVVDCYELRAAVFAGVAAGVSVAAAGRAVGVSKPTAWRWWSESAPMGLTLVHSSLGGVPAASSTPTGAAAGPGRRRLVSSEDRAVIAAMLQRRARGDQITLAAIGELIGRSVSVISREIARNTGADGVYYAALADLNAQHRRRRPKQHRLHANPALCAEIEDWMDQGWSPKLIATILRREHPGAEAEAIMSRVSHETIYQALYVQTRGSLRQDLHRQLSTHRPRRQPSGTPRRASAFRDAFKIADRPAEVADRAVPGHWEGDLVLGAAGRSAVGVLVERSTRFTILLHLPERHDAHSVATAMIEEMGQLPEHLRLSMTWDRGGEMARYDKVQLDLAMPVYFCDPHSPWQRGTGENTNRLLRHWLTKGTDLSRFTAADLRRIAASLNARPRPTLDLRTPAQALDELLSNQPAA